MSFHFYLTKMLNGHNWLTTNSSHTNSPISNDTVTLKYMHTSKVPRDTNNTAKLQLKMGFHYRQAIGELMFAAVTCRPDVLFPTATLRNHNASPEECHYEVVK